MQAKIKADEVSIKKAPTKRNTQSIIKFQLKIMDLVALH